MDGALGLEICETTWLMAVRGDRIVDGGPAYLLAAGRTLAAVEAAAAALRPPTRVWRLPGPVPEVIPDAGLLPDRRWRHTPDDHPQAMHHVDVGVLPDGRWWVMDTANSQAVAWPDETAALADIQKRMAGDPEHWAEV